MPSFKVCTYHVKLDGADQIYEKIFNLTSKINKKYCELNNYSYISTLYSELVFDYLIDEEIFKIDKKWDKACIFKYKYLLDILNTSNEDFIVYIEYDACFCNTIKKLENYVDDQHSIFYSRCNWSYDVQKWIKDFIKMLNYIKDNENKILNFDTCSDILASKELIENFVLLGNIFIANEGFYIFKNNELTKKFLKAIIKYAPLFYDNKNVWITEGQTLQFIMKKDLFRPYLKVLPPKTQGHIRGGSNKFNEDECLVCHNSSIDKNILYQFLISISKNKYWEKYLL